MTTSRLDIHELAPLGDGIHRADRERVYVERTLPGDIVDARVHKAPGGIMRAEVAHIVEASRHRCQAPCPHYVACGGCTLQHAQEDFYRAWKVETVRTALSRQHLTPNEWLPPIFLPAGSRRRATFAAVKKKDAVTLGYFRRRSHVVSEIKHCLIADPDLMNVRTRLATLLSPVLQEGKSADVFIQQVGGAYDVVVTGPVGKRGVPDLQMREAAAEIAERMPLSRLSWRRSESDGAEIIVERSPLIAKFGGLAVALPPLAFLQPTQGGEDALAAAVMDALPDRGHFADLYSGCGTFTGRMLDRGSVDAYESSEAAVRALEKSVGERRPRALRRDLFRMPLSATEVDQYDAIVFDPPRAGAETQVQALAEGNVPRLVGVSCNPVTFARDARVLIDGGYRLESVRIIDQFPWSHHVELVGVFGRP